MTAAEGRRLLHQRWVRPAIAGGTLSPTAKTLPGNGVPVNSAVQLQARLQLADGGWGPRVVGQVYQRRTGRCEQSACERSALPSRQGQRSKWAAGYGKDDFEFVELVNVSGATIDLAQVRFEQTVDGADLQGIAFDFSSSAIQQLAPGARLVVVEDVDAFALRYPGSVSFVAGEWTGGLANYSERLRSLRGSDTGRLCL